MASIETYYHKTLNMTEKVNYFIAPSEFLKEKYSTNPIIKVVRLEKKKICQSGFRCAMSKIMGNSIAIASMHSSNPTI